MLDRKAPAPTDGAHHAKRRAWAMCRPSQNGRFSPTEPVHPKGRKARWTAAIRHWIRS